MLAAWPTIQKEVPDAALLIAPRHPDRFDEVSGLIRKSGYPFFRCSHLLTERDGTESWRRGTILLLDTIGDLASMYGVATVAFVGGSLVAKGGHNPLEPAQFGVPVVMGPSFENFREIVERMRAANGILIVSPPRRLCRRWLPCCGMQRALGRWGSGDARYLKNRPGRQRERCRR